MNLEKLIEWGVIILVVILGVRWLAGLFGTGDPVRPVAGIYAPGYGGYYYGMGLPSFSPMVGLPMNPVHTWARGSQRKLYGGR